MRTNWKKIFLLSLIGSLAVSALFAIGVFVLGGSFGVLEKRILATALWLVACSLAGLGNAAYLAKKNASRLALGGIAFSFLAFWATVGGIWEVGGLQLSIWNGADGFLHLCLSLALLSVATAHASLLRMAQNDGSPRVQTAATLTLAFIGILTLMLLAMIHGFHFAETDPFRRATGVVAVLDALGTVVTPLLKRIQP